MKNIKRAIFISFAVVYTFNCALAQVSEFKWELDYEIYLKMSNDSNYTYDIKNVFHVTDDTENFSSEFIFYPINPGGDYANELKQQKTTNSTYTTLWSALHANIGGGWVHFVNCLAYAIETGKLNLRDPIMKRPETDWKPNPVTESYKRTKKWDYFIPLQQKNAQKEYNTRLKKEELGDLRNLPKSYVDLLTNTSQKEYNKLLMARERNKVAKMDLVKIIMGANYLGEAQITHISNATLNAITGYTAAKLPSVIIFDNYDAAAAMSLNSEGYVIESIVFKASANLSETEIEARSEKISKIITNINAYNNKAFEKRLKSYYKG